MMKKKKIAFVAHGLGNGGAERVASILASKLAREEYDVMYLSVYSEKVTYHLDEQVRYHYLDVNETNKVIKYIKRSFAINSYLKEFNPDYVISFITQEMLWVELIGRYKIIYSERTNPSSKSKCLQWITNFLYKKSYRVVFQTNGARDYFCDIVRNKSVIIANPMKTDLPYWNEETHNKTIVTACRITPEKNLKMLIRAFAKIKDYYPEYTVEIYGEPRYFEAKQELVVLAEELGVIENVKFPGYNKDIHQIIAKSEVFTLTSDYEGLSNSMLEALCIGIPVICTDCPAGGAAMYIENGKNGFLVNVNDVDGLALTLEKLLSNSVLQKELSNNAVKIRADLSVEKIIKQWESLFM